MNLIPDSHFENGFTVLSQKDHRHNDAIRQLDDFTYGQTRAPSWKIAQWDSGPCLWRDRIDSDKYTLTDGLSKWVTYDPDEKALLLRLNTAPYYQGKGAVKGDYWPHLLIEESFGYDSATLKQRVYYSGAVDSMRLSLDLRMPYYSAVPNTDNWVEAAQLYAYVTVNCKKDRGGRFVWLGIQLFDSRFARSTTSWHIDSGKADASNQMIYLLGLNEAYPKGAPSLWGKDGLAPQITNEWLHVDVDLIPHMRDMLRLTIEKGYFPADTAMEDLYINYMNFGWESIATYDSGVQIKDLRLDSRFLSEE